ncbi:hypothetical protein TRVL_03889 [Trypanosoma vivax]|nr:hypothetical protein TRVL_03889 [Trypanosoma vivax]
MDGSPIPKEVSVTEGNKKDQSSPLLRVIGSFGPLFVCHDTSVFLPQFPQMLKKDYGSGHLSIEELNYLSLSFRVVFDRQEDEGRHVAMSRQHRFSCDAYRQLTDKWGLSLRHGSKFGAAFIGYHNVSGHSDYLIFFGPLSRLAAIAAVRVASSVGKEAWSVEKRPDSTCGYHGELSFARIENSKLTCSKRNAASSEEDTRAQRHVYNGAVI